MKICVGYKIGLKFSVIIIPITLHVHLVKLLNIFFKARKKYEEVFQDWMSMYGAEKQDVNETRV